MIVNRNAIYKIDNNLIEMAVLYKLNTWLHKNYKLRRFQNFDAHKYYKIPDES